MDLTGIVNVNDPYHIVFDKFDQSTGAIKPYALAIKDNYLYVIGTETNLLVVKEIIRKNI